MKPQQVLFIGKDNTYVRKLKKGLSSPSQLIIEETPRAIAMIHSQAKSFMLVIVDSADNDYPLEIIKKIRDEAPNIIIVVTTMLPDWEPARAAIQAGAVDYIPLYKTKDILNLVNKIANSSELSERQLQD